jgi:hypothetical protein
VAMSFMCAMLAYLAIFSKRNNSLSHASPWFAPPLSGLVLSHPAYEFKNKTRFFCGPVWIELLSESALLALLGKLLSAFFCVNENIVRISEPHFHSHADLSEMSPIVKFNRFK